MRTALRLATLTACVLTGAALCSTAMASPYYYRNTNGSWTNAEYNDGACHISYSRNAYDQETRVNRWGDCSQVAVGPNGEIGPTATSPVVIQRAW
jgi:hypothetical protein